MGPEALRTILAQMRPADLGYLRPVLADRKTKCLNVSKFAC